jgi:hypothetical protein
MVGISLAAPRERPTEDRQTKREQGTASEPLALPPLPLPLLRSAAALALVCGSVRVALCLLFLLCSLFARRCWCPFVRLPCACCTGGMRLCCCWRCCCCLLAVRLTEGRRREAASEEARTGDTEGCAGVRKVRPVAASEAEAEAEAELRQPFCCFPGTLGQRRGFSSQPTALGNLKNERYSTVATWLG